MSSSSPTESHMINAHGILGRFDSKKPLRDATELSRKKSNRQKLTILVTHLCAKFQEIPAHDY